MTVTVTATHDDAARERLEAALADRALLEHPVPELVRDVRVVIYGAGNVGREVARLLQSAGPDCLPEIGEGAGGTSIGAH